MTGTTWQADRYMLAKIQSPFQRTCMAPRSLDCFCGQQAAVPTDKLSERICKITHAYLRAANTFAVSMTARMQACVLLTWPGSSPRLTAQLHSTEQAPHQYIYVRSNLRSAQQCHDLAEG